MMAELPGEMGLRITVLGRGAWGSTLARLWQDDGHAVRSWSRRDGGDAVVLLSDCDLVVSAVSMAAVAGLARSLAPHWPAPLPLLSCSKGLDLDGLCSASQLWVNTRPWPDLVTTCSRCNMSSGRLLTMACGSLEKARIQKGLLGFQRSVNANLKSVVLKTCEHLTSG